MEGKDRRQEEERQLLLLLPQKQHRGQPGGAGDESPVLGIPAAPLQEKEGAEISAAAEPHTNTEENDPEADDADKETEFEFSFASNPPTITNADEIFSQGRIRPVYPVFDRGLFLYYQSQAALAAAEEEDQQQQQQHSTAPLRLPLRDLMRQHQRSASTAEGPKTARSSVHAGSSSASTSSSSSSAVRLARASSFSSSDADDLEGLPAGTYCVWTPGSVPPSPENLGRKSRSTGSTCTRRWRLRDLVLGRSHSDGRRKLMLFQHEGEAEDKSAAGSSKAEEQEEEDAKSRKKMDNKSNESKDQGNKKGGKTSNSNKDQSKNQRKKKSELDLATAHRLYYNNNSNNLKSGGGAAAGASADGQGPRRSSTFLPYRKDLFVGIFPHARSPGRGLGLGSSHAPPSFYGF